MESLLRAKPSPLKSDRISAGNVMFRSTWKPSTSAGNKNCTNLKPQMNTDEHGATQPQPKAWRSSCLWGKKAALNPPRRHEDAKLLGAHASCVQGCSTPRARWKRALPGTEPPRSLRLCGEILFGCG